MNYKPINTQSDLDELNAQVCWDDSDLIEMHVSRIAQSYFPNDIQYSGHAGNMHYHCLYRACSAPQSHLEIIFIGTEIADHHKMVYMFLDGKVLSGYGIELFGRNHSIALKCARIIYRFVEIEDARAPGYFLRPGILDYPKGSLATEGYYHTVCGHDHLLLSEKDHNIEIILSHADEQSCSIKLSLNQAKELADNLLQAL